MNYQYECIVCQKVFEQISSYAERYNVFHCGKRCIKYISSNIHIHDDMMYKFTGEFKGEKVDIHSKRQYNRILKEKRLVDVTVPEVNSVRKKQTSLKNKHDLNKLSDRIQERVAKDGLTKHLDPLIRKCSTKQGGEDGR